MPLSLAEALTTKYNSDEEDDDANEVGTGDALVIFAPKAGFHKCVPNTVIVTSSAVNEAGDPETLSKFLGNATEIDVSRNQISDINEIAAILQSAPKLKTFNLGFNDLAITSIPQPINFPIVESLHALILVGTKAPWPIVWNMLSHAINVEDVHLSVNNYEDVSLTVCNCDGDGGNVAAEKVTNCTRSCCKRIYENVKTAMFDENPVKSWEEISKLGIVFPNLRFLSLTSCPIKNIPSNGHENFKCLKTLWMSNSQIDELDDLENIQHFPSLADLRISGMPFLKDFPEEKRRQHIIALLPNIETLNRGREISENERETAERNFIRHYRNQEDPPARYHQLKDEHGGVPDLVNITFKPPSKVNLVIRLETKEVARMAVNLKMSVRELKDLLEPVVGIRKFKMNLYYHDIVGEAQNIMKFQDKKLYTYNMQDNDEIIIKESQSTSSSSFSLYGNKRSSNFSTQMT